MSPLRRVRKELGAVREARRSSRSLSAVRAERADKERLILRDAAALGCGEAEMRRAHEHWKDGVVTLATRFGRIHLRPRDTDLLVIRQVLIDREYDIGKLEQMTRLRAAYDAILADGATPVVIDAGANIGAGSIWFAAEFPKATVIAVEPDPGNAAIARLNLAELPSARVAEAAIGSEPGKVKLQAFENQGWGARTERSDDGIAIVTVNDLVAEVPNGRLLLAKIDIEGFEGDLFERNVEWVDQAAAIIVEPHDWMLPGAGSSQSMQAALLGKGRELLIAGENLIFI